MADIFNLTDTWNSSGTTFTAIKMDVTDTNSAAGSKLLELLKGGVSMFTVTKAGGLVGPTGATLTITAGTSQNLQLTGATVALVGIVQFTSAIWGRNGASSSVFLPSAAQVGFGTSSDNTGTNDAAIMREAASVLAVRGGGATSPAAMSFYTHGASPPSAPAASIARIYADTSGGKIRLMAVFPSGAAQQIAIEP